MAKIAGLVNLAEFSRELNGMTLKTALALGRKDQFPRPRLWPLVGAPLFSEMELRAYLARPSRLIEQFDGEPADDIAPFSQSQPH